MGRHQAQVLLEHARQTNNSGELDIGLKTQASLLSRMWLRVNIAHTLRLSRRQFFCCLVE
jgi:hypothetical protein